MKFGERFCIGLLICWFLFAVHQGVNALVRAHNWQPMTISDWGTWAGAIGTIAAVMASFFLFQRQRDHELRQARDDELQRRVLAMQTVADVAYLALDAVRKLAEIYDSRFEPGITPNLAHRLPELRAILDRFAEPTADRIVVLVGLVFSTALAETQDDIKVRIPVLEDHISERLHERIGELEVTLDRLHKQLSQLQERCRERGIDINPDDDTFTGA